MIFLFNLNLISYFSNELADNVQDYLQVFDNPGTVKNADGSNLAQLTVALEAALSDSNHLGLHGHLVLGQHGAALREVAHGGGV